MLTRAHSIAEPSGTNDPEYVIGLQEAVSVGVEHALTVVEDGERRAGPLPRMLLDQAAQAARNGVGLDIVLRRYIAAHTVLGDFIVGEAEGVEALRGGDGQRLVRSLATLMDSWLPLIVAEYSRVREAMSRPSSSAQRQKQLIDGLLRGEQAEASQLPYEFNAFHVALVGAGPEVESEIRELATALDRQLLLVWSDDCTVWAWLGGRRGVESEKVASSATEISTQICLAIGEPGEGLGGWRMSTHQARAAWPIARRGLFHIARYAQAPLLSSVLRDNVLSHSLRQLYLVPLSGERDGLTLRDTLRAYLRCDRNASSAAAALGVTRQTINNRLRAAEDRLGRTLSSCAPELELALTIDELGAGSNPGPGRSQNLLTVSASFPFVQ